MKTDEAQLTHSVQFPGSSLNRLDNANPSTNVYETLGTTGACPMKQVYQMSQASFVS